MSSVSISLKHVNIVHCHNTICDTHVDQISKAAFHSTKKNAQFSERERMVGHFLGQIPKNPKPVEFPRANHSTENCENSGSKINASITTTKNTL